VSGITAIRDAFASTIAAHETYFILNKKAPPQGGAFYM